MFANPSGLLAMGRDDAPDGEVRLAAARKGGVG